MRKVYGIREYKQSTEDINFVLYMKNKCPSCTSTLQYREITTKSVPAETQAKEPLLVRLVKGALSKIEFYKKWAIYQEMEERGFFDRFDKTIYDTEVNLVFLCPGCKRTYSVEEIKELSPAKKNERGKEPQWAANSMIS